MQNNLSHRLQDTPPPPSPQSSAGAAISRHYGNQRKSMQKWRESKKWELGKKKTCIGSYWLLHELANWFCCNSLIHSKIPSLFLSAVNSSPLSLLLLPLNSGSLPVCSCQIDGLTDWMSGAMCVCLCLQTQSISSGELFDLVSHQPATEWDSPLNSSTVNPPQSRLKNWKSNVEEWDF